MLAPRSTWLGQTLRYARYREKYGMTVLAIWRADRPIRTDLSDLPLQFGDALLLQGPGIDLALLRTEPDLIVLDAGTLERAGNHHARKAARPGDHGGKLTLAAVQHGWWARCCWAALASGACPSAHDGPSLCRNRMAHRLPRGGDATVGPRDDPERGGCPSERIVAFFPPLGPLALLAGVFFTTTLMTQTMTGAAVAAILAPIAIQTAQQGGMDPRARLAMGVALATSMAFITPLGHPVNVLVMGPGGYRFHDFRRVGLPLTVLLMGVVMILLPIFWPLTAK